MQNRDIIQENIGYCLSTVLKDYSLKIEPSICYILSNALWIGFNSSSSKQYIPIRYGYVSFINPFLIENFNVNCDCLLMSFRSNEINHIEYIKKRIENKKKTLVKVSDNILLNDNCEERINQPVFAIIDNIDLTEEPANNSGQNTIIKLIFDDKTTIELNISEFQKHWTSSKDSTFCAEWDVIYPPQIKSEEIIIRKLKSALRKQYLNLIPNNNVLKAGYSVLEYLKHCLNSTTESDFIKFENHIKIWKNSLPIYHNGGDMYREYYGYCLGKLKEFWKFDFSNLISSFNEAGFGWQEFSTSIQNNSISQKQQLLSHYNNIISLEINVLTDFKRVIYKMDLSNS